MRSLSADQSAAGFGGWLRALRRFLPGGSKNDDFVSAVLESIKPYLVLDEPQTGRWYATAEAVDYGRESNSNQIGVRFLVSREPRTDHVELSSGSLRRVVRVRRDFGSEQERSENLVLFFNFTGLLPVVKNLERFKEFALAQIRDVQTAPPGAVAEEAAEAERPELSVSGVRGR